jgi:hypothetical protein
MVYFDKDSTVGHPSADKWIPLEIKEGRKTDVAHNCPKRNISSSNGSTLDNNNTTETTTTTTAAIIVKPEMLQFAETLSQILQDYVRLKKSELVVVTRLLLLRSVLTMRPDTELFVSCLVI